MGQPARAAALAAALGMLAGPLGAQDDPCGFGIDDETLATRGAPLAMLFGTDDRRIMNSSAYPWRAIGNLVTPYGTCTGTLVDDNLVLTAAHCVSDYVEGRIAPSDVIFLAGLQDGRPAAHARAERIVTATGRPLQWHPSGDVSDDWAFVVLDRSIGADVGTLAVQLPTDSELDLAVHYRTAVTQAGYSADIEGSLSGHEGCRLLATHRGGWVEHDCDVVPGDSGSPLLFEREGRYYVFAVVSAMQCRSDGVRIGNSAADARAFADAYRQLAHSQRVAVRVATPPGVRVATPGTTPDTGSGGSSDRGGSGPRIVRIPQN